ncbi:MAG: hypothetical protein Q8Q09_15615 [Deltaproteobacteria bacterium]|nr:hypothetical protein [Deltaproteobacteria bacterium]
MNKHIRARMVCGIASLSALALLSGCPGKLDNWQDFVGANEGGTTSCTIAVSMVEQQLVRPRCATSGCHDRGDRAGGLDLQSPNIASRLVDQPSSSCSGRLLVNRASLGESHMLAKVSSDPGCGRQMPLGAPALSVSEVACIRSWIGTLDPNAMTDAGMDVVAPPDVVIPPPDVVQRDVTQRDTEAPETGPMAEAGVDAMVDVEERDTRTPEASVPDATAVDAANDVTNPPMDASMDSSMADGG